MVPGTYTVTFTHSAIAHAKVTPTPPHSKTFRNATVGVDVGREEESIDRLCIRLITVVSFFCIYVCECTVGVDVGDGTTSPLFSINNIVMGCIVLGRQMNVYSGTTPCTNSTLFVGMDVRFCTMQFDDSMCA